MRMNLQPLPEKGCSTKNGPDSIKRHDGQHATAGSIWETAAQELSGANVLAVTIPPFGLTDGHVAFQRM